MYFLIGTQKRGERVEALIVWQTQRFAIALVDEVGVVQEIGVDGDGVVVVDGEPAVVERPVVLLAEAKAVAKIVVDTYALCRSQNEPAGRDEIFCWAASARNRDLFS